MRTQKVNKDVKSLLSGVLLNINKMIPYWTYHIINKFGKKYLIIVTNCEYVL